jgi:predicted ATP-grasp superfamily ATP-dependent carboligase
MKQPILPIPMTQVYYELKEITTEYPYGRPVYGTKLVQRFTDTETAMDMARDMIEKGCGRLLLVKKGDGSDKVVWSDKRVMTRRI